MNLSEETINEVKNRMDILDVISDFVSLKKTGSVYKSLSPFTEEKTPSFFVVPQKGIFKDFSSGVGGDAITFIMQHEKLTFPEAIIYLAKKYGIPIKTKDSKNYKQYTYSQETLNKITSFYHQQLLTNNKALQYLNSRGIKHETIKQFNIGYSPSIQSTIIQFCHNNNIQTEQLQQLGILDKYNNDKFHNRIVFPIHTISGKVVGFGARIIQENNKFPKYINSNETNLYKKSENLFGIYQAKYHIIKKNLCYLVEGYIDVLSFHQAGINNTVGICGTALSDKQIRLILRFTNNIALALDADEPGIKATLRTAKLILSMDANLFIVNMPKGEDPDSLAQKHKPEELTKIISQNTHDFIIFQAIKANNINNPTEKQSVIQQTISFINNIKDPIKQHIYTQECAKIWNINPNKLPIQTNNPELSDQAINHDKKHVHELELLGILLLFGNTYYNNHNTIAEYIFEETSDVQLQHPHYNTIFINILNQFNLNKSINPQELIFNNPELSNLISSIITNKTIQPLTINPNPEPQEILYKARACILYLKLNVVRNIIYNLTNQLTNNHDEITTNSLIDQIQQFKNIEQQILQEIKEFYSHRH